MTYSAIAASQRSNHAERYRLGHVADDALHAEVKTLAGRHNVLTADLLAHLAEVEARGIHRERACSSLYTYCLYELRFSEDEAQRRARAARAAREFPVLFELLAEGAIHLTGLLLLAPYLTAENHRGLLARARFRTKREIERLVAEIAPRPDVPARIEPLGPRRATSANLWQAFTASLRGPVRELVSGAGVGEAPPSVFDDSSPAAVSENAMEPTGVANDEAAGGSAPARIRSLEALRDSPLVPMRYRVEFTASEEYARLLEEARDLLQHQVPNRDIARVHEIAMAAFVEQLRKRRRAASGRPRVDGAARARGDAGKDGQPARVREDAGDDRLRVPASPARTEAPNDGNIPRCAAAANRRSAPARINRGQTTEAGERSGPGARAVRQESSSATTRHVAARIRRVIWQRDEGRCTFTDPSGRRCEERAGLEIDHEHAFALGGPTEIENLRLLCRAHNGLLAERDFGRERIKWWRER